MPDREKIIKEYEFMVRDFCPACTSDERYLEVMKAVLDLLKEQDSVEPRVSCIEQRCGNCNKVIEMDGWKACPWCGKMIDWERWWNENGTHDNT